ncbi:hypothetical protein Q7P35_010133 [Cladosporium inversicolor]
MIRMPLKTTSICVVDKTIMDNTHPFAKDSESLLASDSEDGEPYVPVRQKAPHAIDAHAIEYEVRSYSKPLDYDDVSQKAVIANNGDRNYGGPPSLESDAAWTDLLHGRFIEMTPTEVEPFKPQLKSISHSGRYIFEPEVFHALHCVDTIRLHVSSSMYPNVTTLRTRQQQSHYEKMEKISPGIKELHMEH